MHGFRIIALLAIVAMPPLAQGDAIGRLFSTPQLTRLSADHPIVYRHTLASSIEGASGRIDEPVRVGRSSDGHVEVTFGDGDSARRIPPFRGMTGNPILMVFLESVVSAASESSGGSPFYMRSRIKEAMRERLQERPVSIALGGAQAPAYELSLSPFENDAHASALGAFTGLELRFVLSDAAPGTFVSLAATTGGDRPLYTEEIRLDESD